MKKEKWKKLKEDSNYLISSWGRVFSIKNKQFIKPYIHKSMHTTFLRVCLAGNRKYMLHIIVAANFKKKEFNILKELHPDKRLEVNHKDRNSLNPNLDNLEWTTHSENIIHMHDTNRFVYGGKEYKTGGASK